MATVTNKKYTLKGFVSSNNLKHLLYRRANILNMYNYTKVDVYVNWCVILTEIINNVEGWLPHQLDTLGSILSEASYMLSSSRTKLLSSRYWATWNRTKRKTCFRTFLSFEFICTLFKRYKTASQYCLLSTSMVPNFFGLWPFKYRNDYLWLIIYSSWLGQLMSDNPLVLFSNF